MINDTDNTVNQSKAKVITPANHKGHGQYSAPIKHPKLSLQTIIMDTENSVDQSKPKVITLANHNEHRQYSEPIKNLK